MALSNVLKLFKEVGFEFTAGVFHLQNNILFRTNFCLNTSNRS